VRLVGGLFLRREYPNQPIVGVGVVVIDSGKLVLVRRGVEPALGKWSFPGGGVELGESVRDAVIRETKEEIGLDVYITKDTPIDAYDIITFDKEGLLQFHFVLLHFLARPKNGVLKPSSDVTDAKWVPLGEVENYDLATSVRSFFVKHRKELESY
jgi:8-oxo-dGTP diphosphatase